MAIEAAKSVDTTDYSAVQPGVCSRGDPCLLADSVIRPDAHELNVGGLFGYRLKCTRRSTAYVRLLGYRDSRTITTPCGGTFEEK